MEPEAAARLRDKTAHEALVCRIAEDLHLAPFLARAYLEQMSGYLLEYGSANLEGGQLQYCAVSADEPAGVALADARRVSLVLTLHTVSDLDVAEEQGLAEMRRQRIVRLCNEALDQGGLLTQEDLAVLLTTSHSTIKRDLRQLRAAGQWAPTRGEQRDIGPATSHKIEVISRYLRGEDLTEISRRMRHGIDSMERYLRAFRQVALATAAGLPLPVIAKAVAMSENLVKQYQELYQQAVADGQMSARLDDLLASPKGGR